MKKPKRTVSALLRFFGLDYEATTLNYSGRAIELTGLERDSLPLLDEPLTTARIGHGRPLDGLAGEAVQGRLRELGYDVGVGLRRGARTI